MKKNKGFELGEVIGFTVERGFGFIKVNGTDEEIFFHISGHSDLIRQGFYLWFEDNHYCSFEHYPKTGDRVVFKRCFAKQKNTFKVRFWCYFSDFQKVEKQGCRLNGVISDMCLREKSGRIKSFGYNFGFLRDNFVTDQPINLHKLANQAVEFDVSYDFDFCCYRAVNIVLCSKRIQQAN